MASRRPSLGSHLEWHNGTIRVTVAVPRKLQSVVGATRLKRSLNTDSPSNAERIKHGVVQELKNQIVAATLKAQQGRTVLTDEALEWRADIESQKGTRDSEAISFLLSERAEEIERKANYESAREFHDIATGRATPIEASLETYLATSGMKPRSCDEARRAVRVYREWSAAAGVPQTVEGITRKVAGRFVTERLLPQMSRKTTEKYLSFLSGYWKWLVGKGFVETSPWGGQLAGVRKGQSKRANIAAAGANGSNGKRPYTMEEARTLLYANVAEDKETGQRTADITWIAALSGMRLDEICRLRVGDCEDGRFRVNSRPGEGKTDAGVRTIPIHSELTALVARRTAGKDVTDYLIEDLPEPGEGSNRERSMPASKAYTRFRRDLGIDERAEGQRQSNVDFHSWRRWFIREAKEAGHTLWTIADVVGHDTESLPGGLTMGTYPGPASEKAMRACVESVKPPQPASLPESTTRPPEA